MIAYLLAGLAVILGSLGIMSWGRGGRPTPDWDEAANRDNALFLLFALVAGTLAALCFGMAELLERVP